MYNTMTIAKPALQDIWAVETLGPKSSHHKNKFFLFFYIYMRGCMLSETILVIILQYL